MKEEFDSLFNSYAHEACSGFSELALWVGWVCACVCSFTAQLTWMFLCISSNPLTFLIENPLTWIWNDSKPMLV